jgi:hypothetical protein
MRGRKFVSVHIFLNSCTSCPLVAEDERNLHSKILCLFQSCSLFLDVVPRSVGRLSEPVSICPLTSPLTLKSQWYSSSDQFPKTLPCGRKLVAYRRISLFPAAKYFYVVHLFVECWNLSTRAFICHSGSVIFLYFSTYLFNVLTFRPQILTSTSI